MLVPMTRLENVKPNELPDQIWVNTGNIVAAAEKAISHQMSHLNFLNKNQS